MLSKRSIKQRGIGLIELMLVLLVIVMIVFTTTYYFQVANQNLKVTQAEEQINNIVDASYKWLAGNPNFSTVSIDVLEQAGFLPKNYNINPWKGALKIGPATDTNKLFLQMTGIPMKSCQNLMEKMRKYAPDANCNFMQIQIKAAQFSGTF